LQKPLEISREEILQLDSLQKEQAARISRNPLKYFWPHQKNCDGINCSQAHISYETYDGKKYLIRGCPQFEFLSSGKDIKAFFGGNRSGKTTAGVIEVSYHATGDYPDWWRGRRWDRPTIGRVFASDFAKGVRVVTKKLKEWLPKDAIVEVYRNNQKADVEWYIRHKSGATSYFDVMSYEQEVDLAEGWSGDWALFDEPPPREMYIATARGLVDTDGLTLFTLTPLKEPWLFDEIYNSKNQDVFSVLCDLRHNLERYNPLSYQMIGLKEAAIRKFEMKLTEEERETRLHGKFRYLAGRIWKEWDRDIHTFDRRKWVKGKENVIVDGEPPHHWPRCLIVDPHDRNPHALLWVAIDETEEAWAYREAYLAEHTIEAVVEHIKRVELFNRERVALRILDPNFGPKKYANSGNTVRDEFEMAGKKLNYPVRFTFGDDHKEVARKAVAELLKFDAKKPLSLLNHPRLHVANDLKECIYQVEHYIWDEFKLSDKDPKEKPKDINTHFPDLLQYFSLSKFRWTKPKMHEGAGSFYGTHR
jgi:phage terminase large subunit-like protein